METIQNILLTALLAVWVGVSIAFLVTLIQGAVNDHKREKREIERDKRDLEYHQERMKSLK